MRHQNSKHFKSSKAHIKSQISQELVLVVIVLFALCGYVGYRSKAPVGHAQSTAISNEAEPHTEKFYQREREIRDVELVSTWGERKNREIFNLTASGGKVDLGTPCLTKLNSQDPIITHGRSASGHYFAPFKCTTHVSPISGRQQCCCREYKERPDVLPKNLNSMQGSDELPYVFNDNLRCLPNFIVIGAQKSGTTALMGYLITHPNFSPPINKEIHWLDQNRKFRRGANWYITRFHTIDHPGTAVVYNIHIRIYTTKTCTNESSQLL